MLALELPKSKKMTREEELELWKKAKGGDIKARDALVLNNLRVVVSEIDKAKFHVYTAIPSEDLYQTGFEALIRAVDAWDPERFDIRFSTYGRSVAVLEVRRHVQNNSRLIRLPVAVLEQLKALNAVEDRLRRELVREPRLIEVEAEWAKVLEERQKQPAIRQYKSVLELHAVQNREPVSLDQLIEVNSAREACDALETE